MTWVRKDDQMPIHRKVAPLSDAAYRLLDEAICWSSRNQTDGRISAADLTEISRRGKPKNADELVDRGLWHVAGGRCSSEQCAESGPDGWVIHDYLDYNPSKDKAAKEKAAKAERQQRWLDKRRADGPSGDGSGDASRSAPVRNRHNSDTDSRLQRSHRSPLPKSDRESAQESATVEGHSRRSTGFVDASEDGAPSRPVPSRPEGSGTGDDTPSRTTAARRSAAAGSGGRRSTKPPPGQDSIDRRLTGAPNYDAIAQSAVQGQRRGALAAEVRGAIRKPTPPPSRRPNAFDELRAVTGEVPEEVS